MRSEDKSGWRDIAGHEIARPELSHVGYCHYSKEETICLLNGEELVFPSSRSNQAVGVERVLQLQLGL